MYVLNTEISPVTETAPFYIVRLMVAKIRYITYLWCDGCHHKHQSWITCLFISFIKVHFVLFFFLKIYFLLFSFSDLSLTSNPAVPMLENMFSALLHPDEALKASVLYAWIKLFKTISNSAAQSLPKVIMDRVCIVLLQTLTNASSPNLIQNCVGRKK